ncbi:thiol-disulfide oxidoreductase DCC family protein [Marinobacterium jannaschii]|uniref:thiol-disulfide oxidoreductase DCC family protein n=1 Tax=Marinobacterium jannaschii TaxID=64970 RepID=UPI00056BEEE4|nr:DCC1-like thiol-disulfide oxidoreductase family protein [Marinobacterium jannaschii]
MSITVLYDGRCRICRSIIQQYRQMTGDSIEWFDITGEDLWLRDRGILPEAARRELHVLDEQRNRIRGVDAIRLLWSHLPKRRFQLLASMMRFAPFYWCANRLYRLSNLRQSSSICAMR